MVCNAILHLAFRLSFLEYLLLLTIILRGPTAN